ADQAQSGHTADATAAASKVASASTAKPFIAPVETSNKLKLLQVAILGGNVPQMVLYTISYALELRSSDIHIEPETFTVRIRYRIDGVLRQVVEYPLNIHPAVI